MYETEIIDQVMNNVERDIVLKLFDWNIVSRTKSLSVAPQTPSTSTLFR